MTVGFQCFNTAGNFQIDGVFPQFAFKRKIQVTCNLVSDSSSAVAYRTGDFAISSGEIAAIVCNTPCAILRRMNGYARLATLEVFPSAVVTVYIFGGVLPIGSNFGFEVYNPAGQLVFDGAQKPLAMVGFPVGEGDSFHNFSRKYAAIVMNQYVKVESTGHGFGDVNRIKMTMGMVKEIAGGINISNYLFSDWSQSMDPGQAAADNTIPPISVNRHIIVDVTNY